MMSKCIAMTFQGNEHTQTPVRWCENEAVDGELFCTEHYPFEASPQVVDAHDEFWDTAPTEPCS